MAWPVCKASWIMTVPRETAPEPDNRCASRTAKRSKAAWCGCGTLWSVRRTDVGPERQVCKACSAEEPVTKMPVGDGGASALLRASMKISMYVKVRGPINEQRRDNKTRGAGAYSRERQSACRRISYVGCDIARSSTEYRGHVFSPECPAPCQRN